jgi:hypothetical protein
MREKKDPPLQNQTRKDGPPAGDRRDVFYCVVRALCRGDDFLRERERSVCPQFLLGFILVIAAAAHTQEYSSR